ncbi:potassium-transporting ATPase subunit KdpC [Mumia sp. zg.B53]|uniref:potassium-transporting ATPase subunit KdpC n=1 Tax=unclassified Mumia TaxID=2621872 RepID=UPI001C6E4D89|nr:MULTISPECIES: potassium-transporting ATPase subunit KdpC [unclassified Mumia]MBW9207886.1 potassium-transporting ATPase subunit KdpC [Mumia sp. zg.B17]MBW9209768.1 potassium-transporting ATPase subunit KdpC [Mumia sp. zg.B21]MBW9214371.1 potassium-transporting ATPase subunit KdpC [Mumia sp. zg.B53]MDD9347455.1 potassium-transporting ATPase subunit KdpC [Mumia sp.]
MTTTTTPADRESDAAPVHAPLGAGLLRQTATGLRILLVLTVILGIGYPAAVWAVGQVVAHDHANGQVVEVDGRPVGSAIIGQTFEDPALFHPRPSATEYDALASAASNLGPSNPDLLASIEERRTAVAEEEGVAPSDVPADALTASGSGLDPHISPVYADLQVARVAEANGLDPSTVRDLVTEHTAGRTLGFLGEEGVNVLLLNLAILDAAKA